MFETCLNGPMQIVTQCSGLVSKYVGQICNIQGVLVRAIALEFSLNNWLSI